MLQAAEHLGAGLRQARESAGLSQRALAAQCAMSAADVSRIEGGKRQPSLAALVALARALDARFVIDPRLGVLVTRRKQP